MPLGISVPFQITSASSDLDLLCTGVVCNLQVGGVSLSYVKQLMYLGVLFPNEGRMELEIDRLKQNPYWDFMSFKPGRKRYIVLFQDIVVTFMNLLEKTSNVLQSGFK